MVLVEWEADGGLVGRIVETGGKLTFEAVYEDSEATVSVTNLRGTLLDEIKTLRLELDNLRQVVADMDDSFYDGADIGGDDADTYLEDHGGDTGRTDIDESWGQWGGFIS